MTELRPEQNVLVLRAENDPEPQKVEVKRVCKGDTGRVIPSYAGVCSNTQKEAQLRTQSERDRFHQLLNQLTIQHNAACAVQRAYVPSPLAEALGGIGRIG